MKFKYPILRGLVYLLVLVALAGVVAIDANAEGSKFFEDSLTERTQEAIFLLLAVGMLFIAQRQQHVALLASMFAGFFMICFIRELDALLEQNIGTGTWQVLVTAVLLLMIYRARSGWVRLQREFEQHIESYSFGLFAAGFLTTFVFSRLIGNEELWMAIMEEDYRRNIKNAVEESTELLGDALLLFSGIEFYCRYTSQKPDDTKAS